MSDWTDLRKSFVSMMAGLERRFKQGRQYVRLERPAWELMGRYEDACEDMSCRQSSEIEQLRAENERLRGIGSEGCTCQSCGRIYRGDLLVPDEVWAAISNGCELLCASCIAGRIIDAGIWTAIHGEDIDLHNPNATCQIVHSDPPTAPDFVAVGARNAWRERCGND